MSDVLFWLGLWALGIVCGGALMYWIESTRGADYEKAAQIHAVYQAALEKSRRKAR